MATSGGMRLEEAAELRERDPAAYVKRSMDSMARHVEAMLALKRAGAVAFDYGNNIRKQAFDAGCKDAFEFPGFVPEYIRPLFCEGKGPFAGSRFPAITEDIARPTISRWNCFPMTHVESLAATGA